MCLAIPGKITKIEKDLSIVRYDKLETKAKNIIKAKIGEYVLVQNKMIVEKINKNQAKAFLENLK